MTADEIIHTLGLRPHPEGGHYAETFRDSAGAGRAASTAIYFLLRAGEVSRWHTVDAAEVWHFYAGEPLEISIHASGTRTVHTLGLKLDAGARPQVVVPAHAWQMARPLGEWTLVGCTVAPGFEFSGFTLAAFGFEPT
jgi:predicted cupin superfamily sugar epimerase